MTLQHVRNGVDFLVVEMVCEGQRIRGSLTRDEQAEVVRRMDGQPASLIAERIGSNERWVTRLRLELGLVGS